MTKKEKYVEPWHQFAQDWQRLASPGRPSKAEITIYKRFLQPALKQKDSRILILGATPEIRDFLVAYKNVKVTLLDINVDMVLAMTKIMKKNANENFIIANWLEAPLRKNSFDAVIGDFVTSNVLKKDLKILLNNIKSWLKPRSYFVSRVDVYPVKYQPITLDELINKYAQLPITKKKINYFWEIGVFATSIIRPNREVRVVDFWNKLKKYYKKGKYIHPDSQVNKFLQAGHQFYPLDKVWTCYHRSEMEKKLKNYFIIKDFDLEDKDIPKQSIIYQLQKK